MRRRGILLAIAVLTGCAPVFAGLDIDEYLPPSELIELDEAAARQQRERVQREVEEARIRAEQRERLERIERERLEAERAARPVAVQRLEQRCLGCHEIELITLRPRTRLGWHWVVLRMQWLNGAALEPGEHGLIAAHLADRRPAPRRRAIVEIAAIAIAVAMGAWLVWRAVGARRARGTATRENRT